MGTQQSKARTRITQEEIRDRVTNALESVQALVAEVASDKLEGSVNRVTPDNASDVVWERLRLLQHVMPIIAAQTKAPGVNEVRSESRCVCVCECAQCCLTNFRVTTCHRTLGAFSRPAHRDQ